MLQRKVQRVLTSKFESPELLQALENLSELYTENTLEGRRNLQYVLQGETRRLNSEVIASFQHVSEELELAQLAINSLAKECDKITSSLGKAIASTHTLVAKTEGLRKQQTEVNERHSVCEVFLKQFTLSDAEVAALDRLEQEPIDVSAETFAALGRITAIKRECVEQLQKEHPGAGQEILDSLNQRLEVGYERLYKWVTDKAKDLEGIAEVETGLRMFSLALRALEAREAYFAHCCQEIAVSRRVVLNKRFVAALTRGHRTQRPIEIHAHDPVRYASDMLAWVHQATATEREFAQLILEEQGPAASAGEHELAVRDVSERALEGLCRPLKSRVDATMVAERDFVEAYRIGNLFDFYVSTMAKHLSPGGKFFTLLKALRAAVYKKFFALVKAQADSLVSSPPPYNSTLTLPPTLRDQLQRLAAIMGIYSQSLVPASIRAADFAPFATAILVPLMQAVDRSASGLDVSSTAVYLVNAGMAIQAVLSKHSFTQRSAKFETLSLSISKRLDVLVEAQFGSILSQCGVKETIRSVEASARSATAETPLSSLPGLDGGTVRSAMRAFTSFLISPDLTFALPAVERLTLPTLRNRTRAGVTRRVHAAYCTMHAALTNPANKYGDVAKELQYTPEELQKILQC